MWSDALKKIRAQSSNPAKKPFCKEISRLMILKPKPDEEMLKRSVYAILKEYFEHRQSIMGEWDPLKRRISKLEAFEGLEYTSNSGGDAGNDFLEYMEDGAWEERHNLNTLYSSVVRSMHRQFERVKRIGYLRDALEKGGNDLRIACMAQAVYMALEDQYEPTFLVHTEYVSTAINKVIAQGATAAGRGAKAAAYVVYCMAQLGGLRRDEYNLACWNYSQGVNSRTSQMYQRPKIDVSGKHLQAVERSDCEYRPDEDETMMLFRGTRLSLNTLKDIHKSGVAVTESITSFTHDVNVWRRFTGPRASMGSSRERDSHVVLMCVTYPLSEQHHLYNEAIRDNYVRFLATPELEIIALPSSSFRVRSMFYNWKPQHSWGHGGDVPKSQEKKDWERDSRTFQKMLMLQGYLGKNEYLKVEEKVMCLFLTPIPLDVAMKTCASKGCNLTII
jgi:hypothetical protein